MGGWGPYIFQNDNDLDMVCELDEAAELEEVKKKIRANKEKYYFKSSTENDEQDGNDGEKSKDDEGSQFYITLHNPSHPDLVREHLNKGALVRVIMKLRDESKGYHLCILAACAMQLGCDIPDWHRDELSINYTQIFRCQEPREQMGRALREYRNGVPYVFQSKDIYETVLTGNPLFDEAEIIYQDLELVPIGPEIVQQNTTVERIWGDFNFPADVCGHCGAERFEDGGRLKRCAGCKKRLY